MVNCDSGDTHYRYRKAAPYGTVQDETTTVRTGGASDGTTTYSLKLVSGANAEYPLLTLDTYEFAIWNATVGSSITLTVCFAGASALKDNEIWMEATYLGTSGSPLGAIATSMVAYLGTAATCATEASTWGGSPANKQKLTLSLTPQEEGYIYVTVKLAKASATVYVDPKVVIT
jgi:hypothetical protein